ncbi:MAG: M24 family metallopeptidase [Thermaceae bacterium]
MKELLQFLEEKGLDALLLTKPESVRYLSGFSSPEDAQVYLSREEVLLLTDGRYAVQAEEESRIPYRILNREERQAFFKGLKGRIGFEAEHLPCARLEELKALSGADWVPTQGVVERLRIRKSPEEIALIRKAQALADGAFGEILPLIRPGVKEVEVSLALEFALRRRGAEAAAFPIIVASGPRGAMPHGVASEKTIQEGEMVTLDFGARYRGYHSDLTRTLGVGRVEPEKKRLFDAVLLALEEVLAELAPGRAARELDALARKVLEREGLARYFSHALGHGVGLSVHEAPGLNAYSEEVLEPGMVVTVEPGVYIPGLAGVRVEELVLVTESGFELLSQLPRGWMTV